MMYRRYCPHLSQADRNMIAKAYRFMRAAGYMLSAQARHERLMAFREARASQH